MHAIEFQATIRDGMIEVPSKYRDEFRESVKVRLQTLEEPAQDHNLIDELMARPLKLTGFRPLTREDVHARAISYLQRQAEVEKRGWLLSDYAWRALEELKAASHRAN